MRTATKTIIVGDERYSSLPNFLQKLWCILNDPQFEEIICWDKAGESFEITNGYAFCRSVLPKYFKHGNLNSFVRQLNLYGFRKVSSQKLSAAADMSDNLQFAHPCFRRDDQELLYHIKRNTGGTKQRNEDGSRTSGGGGVEDVYTKKMVTLPEDDLVVMIHELNIVRDRQASMKNTITQLTRDNILLWQEMATLQTSHRKQNENISKIVQFIGGYFPAMHKRKTPGQQRIVQLDELGGAAATTSTKMAMTAYDDDDGQADEAMAANELAALESANLHANQLALQRSGQVAATLYDESFLHRLQQDLINLHDTEHTAAVHNSDTTMLTGLQLRQRAINRGAMFLEDTLLAGEEPLQHHEQTLEALGSLYDLPLTAASTFSQRALRARGLPSTSEQPAAAAASNTRAAKRAQPLPPPPPSASSSRRYASVAMLQSAAPHFNDDELMDTIVDVDDSHSYYVGDDAYAQSSPEDGGYLA